MPTYTLSINVGSQSEIKPIQATREMVEGLRDALISLNTDTRLSRVEKELTNLEIKQRATSNTTSMLARQQGELADEVRTVGIALEDLGADMVAAEEKTESAARSAERLRIEQSLLAHGLEDTRDKVGRLTNEYGVAAIAPIQWQAAQDALGHTVREFHDLLKVNGTGVDQYGTHLIHVGKEAGLADGVLKSLSRRTGELSEQSSEAGGKLRQFDQITADVVAGLKTANLTVEQTNELLLEHAKRLDLVSQDRRTLIVDTAAHVAALRQEEQSLESAADAAFEFFTTQGLTTNQLSEFGAGLGVTSVKAEAYADAISDLNTLQEMLASEVRQNSMSVGEAIATWDEYARELGFSSREVQLAAEKQREFDDALDGTIGQLKSYLNILNNGTDGHDSFRQAIIQTIGALEIEDAELKQLIESSQLYGEEQQQIASMVQAGIVEFEQLVQQYRDGSIEATEFGQRLGQLEENFKSTRGEIKEVSLEIDALTGRFKATDTTLEDVTQELLKFLRTAGLTDSELREVAEGAGIFDDSLDSAEFKARQLGRTADDLLDSLKAGNTTTVEAGRAYLEYARELGIASREMRDAEVAQEQLNRAIERSQAVAEFNESNKSTVKNTVDGLMSLVEPFNEIIDAIRNIREIVVETFRFMEEGAQLVQLNAAVQRITRLSEAEADILSEVAAANEQVIGTQQLMTGTALLLRGTTGDLNKSLGESAEILVQIARASARTNALQISAGDAYVQLVQAIRSRNADGLTELGLVVDQTSAYKQYADALGVNINALDEAQKTQAILNQVITETGIKLIEDANQITDIAERWEIAGNRVKDYINALKISASIQFAPEIGNANKVTFSELTQAAELAKAAAAEFEAAKASAQGYNEFFRSPIEQSGRLTRLLNDSQLIADATDDLTGRAAKLAAANLQTELLNIAIGLIQTREGASLTTKQLYEFAEAELVAQKRAEAFGEAAENATRVYIDEIDNYREAGEHIEKNSQQVAQLTESLLALSEVRVLDGDTVEIDGVKLRVQGIDTSEIGKGFGEVSEPLAEEARVIAEEFSKLEGVVALASDETGKYGRVISDLQNEQGKLLSTTQILAGVAFPQFNDSLDPEILEVHEAALASAQAGQRGFWEDVRLTELYQQGLIDSTEDLVKATRQLAEADETATEFRQDAQRALDELTNTESLYQSAADASVVATLESTLALDNQGIAALSAAEREQLLAGVIDERTRITEEAIATTQAYVAAWNAAAAPVQAFLDVVNEANNPASGGGGSGRRTLAVPEFEQSQIDGFNAQIEAIKENIEGYERAIAGAEETIRGYEGEIERIEAEMAEIELQPPYHGESFADNLRDVLDWQKAVADANTDLAEAQSELDDIVAENDAELATAIAAGKTEKQIAALIERNDKQVQKQQEKIDNLRLQLEEIQNTQFDFAEFAFDDAADAGLSIAELIGISDETGFADDAAGELARLRTIGQVAIEGIRQQLQTGEIDLIEYGERFRSIVDAINNGEAPNLKALELPEVSETQRDTEDILESMEESIKGFEELIRTTTQDTIQAYEEMIRESNATIKENETAIRDVEKAVKESQQSATGATIAAVADRRAAYEELIDSIKRAASEEAISAATARGDIETVIGLLQLQLNTGLISADEFELRTLWVSAKSALEEYHGALTPAQLKSGEVAAASELVARGLVATGEEAQRLLATAGGVSAETIRNVYEEGDTLESLFGRIGVAIDGLEGTYNIDFETTVNGGTGGGLNLPFEDLVDAGFTVPIAAVDNTASVVTPLEEDLDDLVNAQYELKLEADSTPAYTTIEEMQSGILLTYVTSDYTATLEADVTIAYEEIEKAQSLADTFVDDYTATLEASDQASSIIQGVQDALNALNGSVATVTINAEQNQSVAYVPPTPPQEQGQANTNNQISTLATTALAAPSANVNNAALLGFASSTTPPANTTTQQQTTYPINNHNYFPSVVDVSTFSKTIINQAARIAGENSR